MKRFVWSLLLLNGLALVGGITLCAAPVVLNYQGLLQGSNNLPVNGPVDVTFALYNTATGGAVLWSETDSVDVDNGFYATALGDDVALTLPFDERYYLGVTVSGSDEMLPRQPLAQGVMALSANTAGEFASSAIKSDDIEQGTIDPKDIAANCQPGEVLIATVSGWACGSIP